VGPSPIGMSQGKHCSQGKRRAADTRCWGTGGDKWGPNPDLTRGAGGRDTSPGGRS